VALAPTRALALSREEFHHFLRTSPHAALHILALLSERLRQNSERLQEVAIGRRIQTSLLAPSLLQWGPYEIRSRSEPATEVGGDFYNLFPLEGVEPGTSSHTHGSPNASRSAPEASRLGLVLGDVAGKGVPAALFMAVTTTLIEAKAQLLISPAATLAAANARLYPKLRPAGERQPRFVTAVYGVLDAGTGELRLASAGQTPPIYWPAAGTPHYLRAAGLPLGAFPSSTYEELTLCLSTGDRLLLFSDGFIDGPGLDGSTLGYAGFLQQLQPLGARKSVELIHDLFEADDRALEGVAEPIPRDDRTIMLVTASTP
jgi:sigma-B regulation protein RsbU (phosphoserine phosphatase)